MSLLHSVGRWTATSFGPLGLFFIGTYAAINVRSAAKDGRYSFSVPASIVKSEVLKLFISIVLFWYGHGRRTVNSIPTFSLHSSGRDSLELDAITVYDASDSPTRTDSETLLGNSSLQRPFNKRRSLSTARDAHHVNVTVDAVYGLGVLALLQMVANNLIFVSYLLVDPGTAQLMKSGFTVASALIVIPTLIHSSFRLHFVFVFAQVCGLVLSQWNPYSGWIATSYPSNVYPFVLVQAFLSALSDRYGEKVVQSNGLDLHASNIILSLFNIVTNLLLHFMLRHLTIKEPAFFWDFTTTASLLVIFSNAALGLSNTWMYKYSSIWMRSRVTDATTVVLVIVSAVVFGTRPGLLIGPGAAIVFIASWRHLKGTLAGEDNVPVTLDGQSSAGPRLFRWTFKSLLLTAGTAVSVYSVAITTIAASPQPRKHLSDAALGVLNCPAPPIDIVPPFTDRESPYLTNPEFKNASMSPSPFSNVMAMIRWNAKRMERVPLLLKYQPFFHTVHLSMPGILPGHPPDYHNLTHDQYDGQDTVYIQVARTMKLILEEQPDIEGLFYFHFDAWLDPMAWVNENRQSIWYPSIFNTRQGVVSDGPRFMCMNDTKHYPGWSRWRDDVDKIAVVANNEVKRLQLGYQLDPDEFCVGWSDIYYIPRRFFNDFIFLSHMYSCVNLFHEIAIPLMIHIIDQSRRSGSDPFQSLITRIGDCYGACCDDSATLLDVMGTRCGHHLNYLNQEIVDAHYQRLDLEAEWLGEAQLKTSQTGRA